MKTLLATGSALVLFGIPYVGKADSDPTTFATFINKIIGIINLVIPFIVGLTVFVLIFGIFRYVSAGGSEEDLSKARSLIIYGLLAILLMFSVWGIVVIIKNTIFGDTI